MVLYCCVKGCRNNNRDKKKNPDVVLSFHCFPTNQELRQKWLYAIGRPNWKATSHTRVCSVHFDSDQIVTNMQRKRIKDNACPVYFLPPNYNLDASKVEVCQVCLATDLKLFSLQEGSLKMYMETIKAFNNDDESIGCLPQYLCYECAALAAKCYKLMGKSMTAQTTLLDIFAKNRQVTKQLIRSKNRKELNLTSTLDYYTVVDNVFEFQYDDQKFDISNDIYDKISEVTEDNCNRNDTIKVHVIESNTGIKNEIESHNLHNSSKSKDCLLITNNNGLPLANCDYKHMGSFNEDIGSNIDSINEYKMHSHEDVSIDESELLMSVVKDETRKDWSNKYNDHEDITHKSDVNSDSSLKDEIDVSDTDITIDKSASLSLESADTIENNQNDSLIGSKIKKLKAKHKGERRNKTLKETSLLKYFDIVELSLQDQINDWIKCNKRNVQRCKSTLECDVCSKLFAQKSTLEMHISCHNTGRGDMVCPVCKMRWKSSALLRRHINITHLKKYHCRMCTKTFNKLSLAEKHYKWHRGDIYRCRAQNCNFATRHCSSLGKHVRSYGHSETVCGSEPACGPHPCPHCGRGLVSRSGLNQHLVLVHREAKVDDIQIQYRCIQCGAGFVSEGARRLHSLQLMKHNKLRNIKPTDKVCETCGCEFVSVGDLWAHRRIEHSQQKLSYGHRLDKYSYPAVCEHCGVTVESRREHYWHTRRRHPALLGSYRRVILAVCHICGKGFNNITKLHIHETRHTIPNGAFPCDKCPRAFHDKYALSRHARLHRDTTRDSTHTCPLCGKTFALRKYLDRHKKVHSSETPYECTMCNKKFKWSSGRNVHVRTVHYKQPNTHTRTRNKLAT